MRGGDRAALSRAVRHAPAALGVVLLFAAVWAVEKEFRHLQLADIGREIRAIQPSSLALAFACTVFSYALLTVYDRLGTNYAGHALSYRRVAFASFCAYALSHNLGFAALSGAAVRYRLYAHWGLSPVEIGKTIAFCSLTFGLGGMVLGGAVLILMPGALPYIGTALPHAVLYAFGALLWALVIVYCVLAGWVGRLWVRGHLIVLPDLRMALVQVALATADVAVTATVFWVLLPASPALSWPLFLGVYLASYSAGLLANLPGGLGVFDTAVLFGLAPFLPAPRIVAAIAVFRLYYYIIPLFLAGTLFAGNEVFVRGRTAIAGGAPAQTSRWSEPDFAAAAASGAVALSGFLLLGLGVLAPHVPNVRTGPIATQAGEFVPSLIGAWLVMMAIGLVRRVNLAWTGGLFFLALGAGFILAQGERLWPVGVLVLSAAVLAPFRNLFYRHARLLTGSLDSTSALSLLALAVCGLALAGFRRRVHAMPHNAFWQVVLSAQAPWGLRASIATVVTLALVAVWLLIRPGRVSWRPWGVEARLRLLMLGARPPEHADGLVFGEIERAAIPFVRLDGVLLGLGDPVGLEGDRVSAIWRLRDLARQEGRDLAFWQVGPDLLKVYNDIGLTALPLSARGEPVAEGSAKAREASGYLVCAAERDLRMLLTQIPPGLAS